MSLTLEQQWRERLATYQGSNLTKTEFCRVHDIPYHQFYYWMKKLQGSSTSKQPPVQWWTLDVSSHTPPSSTPLLLQIGNAKIEVEEGFNEMVLRQVIKVLSDQ